METKPPRTKTFLREWRKFRGMTLIPVAEAIGITHGQLSRIERGDSDYTQTHLEGLAQVYGTDTVSLLVRDPLKSEPIWTLVEQADEAQREQIAAVAETILNFRPRQQPTPQPSAAKAYKKRA